MIRTDKGVQTFTVEVADTPIRQEYGLMCRKVLAPDRGMLFLFANQEHVIYGGAGRA